MLPESVACVKCIIPQKVLDRIDGLVLYKEGCAIIKIAHREEKTFNVDELDIQRTHRQTDGLGRHAWRVFIRSELGVSQIGRQYFWRQTRTSDVHR